jgi:hypothetical protein
MGETALAKFVGFMFALTWLVFRILLNPYLYWKLYMHWDELLTISIYLKFFLTLNVGFLSLLNNVFFIQGPFFELFALKVPKDSQPVTNPTPKNAANGHNKKKKN